MAPQPKSRKQGRRRSKAGSRLLKRSHGDAAARSILIADDEEALGRLLAGELTAKGYRCVSLRSKQDAYRWSVQHHPDLIITDIRSPDMDGFQFAQKLKSNRSTKGVPIVFLTGFASVENTTLARRLGAAEVLAKPCRLSDVQAIVERLIGNGKLRQQVC